MSAGRAPGAPGAGDSGPRDPAVLERNLTRLLQRAYQPALPRESFRLRLERDFAARAGRLATATPAARPAPAPVSNRTPEHRSWAHVLAARWPAALAAALLALFTAAVLLTLERGGDSVPLGELLARGAPAARGQPSGPWHAWSGRQERPGAFLELATPESTGARVDGAEARLELAPASRLVVRRSDAAALAVELVRGGVEVVARDPAGVRVESPEGALLVERGGARFTRLESADPALRVEVDSGRTLLLPSSGRPDGSGRALDAGRVALVRAASLVGDVELESDGLAARPQAGRAGARGPVAPRRVDPGGRGLADGGSPAVEPEQPGEPAVDPAPPVQVAGRVVARPEQGDRGPAGEVPVEDFIVLALRQVALPEVVDPAVFEFESAGGRFELSGLTAGRYELFVRAPGHALWRGEPVELPGAAIGSAPLEVEAVLASGAELRGLVLDELTGLPVAGAVVVSETDAPVQILSLTGEEYDQRGVLARAVSGPDGGFELRDLTPGQHVLRVSAPGHAPAWEPALADAAGAEVALELGPGGALEGRITGPGGTPLAGGLVICSLTDFGASHPVMSYASAITDAEGRYELVDLPAGNWPLLSFGVLEEARGPMEPELAFVRIRSGERARHDFAAPAAGLRFEGTLLLPDGTPAVGRALWLTPQGSAGRDLVSTNTDGEGRFALAGLEAQSYAVFTSRGSPPDMTLLGEVDLGDGRDVLEHTLRLAGGALAGSVLHGDGGGGVQYAVVLLLQRDSSEDGAEFLAKTFTDATGAFTFEHVPAGSYDLQVASTERGLGHAASEGLTVAPAQRLEVGELFLYPGGALEVRAVEPDGRPAAGARLRLVFEGRVVHLLESAALDAEGRAHVPGLAAGGWELTLGGGRYRERTLAVDVARSDEPTRVEVELEAR